MELDVKLKTCCSSKCFPNIWIPSGKLFLSFPKGMEMPGKPAKEAGTVNTSFKYILIGSFCFSFKGNAALGAVGVTIISHSLKALLKSSAINFLTFCALRYYAS